MKKPSRSDAGTRLKKKGSDRAVPQRALPKGRLWIFRLLTMVVIPAFILGALELGLRVAGYGYPTSFFNKSRIDGQDFLIPNHQFGYQFFPPALARKSALYRISAEKPIGVYRIFVFGESAALGIPDWSYGVSRYLEVLLDERYPGIEFEVICVAITAINSHAILPVARECARLEGDLWVIYMGNNEMIGPFGAGTIFGVKSPALGFVRTSLALKRTRLGQLMADIVSRLGSKSETPAQWTGINMFKKNLLRHDDPKRLRAYKNFEGNLKDILKTGRKAGVPIVLSTVGSNLRDCSPFASLHREDLDAAGKSEWMLLFREGNSHEQAGHHEEALRHYRDAAAIDPEFAELQFRMGICEWALGRFEEARQAFVRARDYDALVVRADSRINRILMNAIAEENGRLLGVDAEKALAAQSPEGIPGKDFFYEHVHFTVEGNYALARIIADRVSALLPSEILESETENWLGNEACHRQLALTLWNQLWLWKEEAKRVNMMPFISQTSNRANKDHINAKRKAIMARVTKDTPVQDRQLYVAALDRAPEDTFLVEKYSEFLNASGKRAEALEQAERFHALLPDFAWTHCWMAALLVEAGRIEEARVSLEHALEIHSDFIPARELLKRINKQ